ncbi:hypothetical protein GCM10010441_45290 [Kitasatospora paracochleata]|uniref:Uncharacterized protein n=1 Tax=Kitasatospora paracochleata TaxID=58354 RepID=A0ABT1J9H7_9ACTN|nr:hypothetical protein [Kitasatospora paracochleata]MCP2314107.1 hypothetical protein [Kitasatospora paracochleata]
MGTNHSGQFTVERAGMLHHSIDGPTSWWPDGTTSYLLHFAGPRSSWQVADETDTVLTAVDTLNSGEEMSKQALQNALRDTRRLLSHINAIEEELLLYSREAGPNGKVRLSWREIGDEMGLHFTSARDRHTRVASGKGSSQRNWLVQRTRREHMYPTTDGRPAVPPQSDAERAHSTEVCDVPAAAREGLVVALCSCGWRGTPSTNADRARRDGKEHEDGADS